MILRRNAELVVPERFAGTTPLFFFPKKKKKSTNYSKIELPGRFPQTQKT